MEVEGFAPISQPVRRCGADKRPVKNRNIGIIQNEIGTAARLYGQRVRSSTKPQRFRVP